MNKTRIYLIVATVLLLIASVVGFAPAMMSPMMFDSPESQENVATNLFFWSIFSFPAVCLLAIPLAWIVHAFRKHRLAIFCTLLPLVNLVIGSLALLYLQVFNQGNFGN
jgi:hypothetical protein